MSHLPHTFTLKSNIYEFEYYHGKILSLANIKPIVIVETARIQSKQMKKKTMTFEFNAYITRLGGYSCKRLRSQDNWVLIAS